MHPSTYTVAVALMHISATLIKLDEWISYPEDEWYGISEDWDLNLWYDDLDKVIYGSLYQVVDGEIQTKCWWTIFRLQMEDLV